MKTMKSAVLVVSLLVTAVTAGCSKTLSCSDAVDKLFSLCPNLDPAFKSNDYKAFCETCSSDGSARWASCMTDAKTCDQAEACSCSAQ